MLAELIETQMEAWGWKSRSPLVRKSGLSQTLISKLLHKEIINITVETADLLAGALGVPPDDVFQAALADVRAQRLAPAIAA